MRLLFMALAATQVFADSKEWAEIRVVDDATGRGVPMVELTTVNELKFITDNEGRIAFHEPGLMGREVYFSVRSHGYEMKKDGFGFAGARITPRAGQTSEIKITRKNIAERLARLTGEGRYRDSILLGHPHEDNNGLVAGQDSVQAAIYRGRVYWLWGDTQQMKYPLGLFRTAGATTPVPDAKADVLTGLRYDYFVDAKTHYARAMMPLVERPQGVIWISGVFTLQDEKGAERLLGHYSRRKGLSEEYEQGLAVFNDEKAIFEPLRELPLKETCRKPHGHPILWETEGKKYLLFGSPNPNVRVPANWQDVLNLDSYAALHFDGTEWRWQTQKSPTDSNAEHRLLKAGTMKPEQSRFSPVDANSPQDRVLLHSGSVRWNDHRNKWVLVAGQNFGKSSMLGEVWYAEADAPTGPFAKAVKIVTHSKQSFYNVCHHAFLDRDGGRTIHFEGTYTNEFSGPDKTPRYNYNQILYRLDLDAAARKLASPK